MKPPRKICHYLDLTSPEHIRSGSREVWRSGNTALIGSRDRHRAQAEVRLALWLARKIPDLVPAPLQTKIISENGLFWTAWVWAKHQPGFHTRSSVTGSSLGRLHFALTEQGCPLPDRTPREDLLRLADQAQNLGLFLPQNYQQTIESATFLSGAGHGDIIFNMLAHPSNPEQIFFIDWERCSPGWRLIDLASLSRRVLFRGWKQEWWRDFIYSYEQKMPLSTDLDEWHAALRVSDLLSCLQSANRLISQKRAQENSAKAWARSKLKVPGKR